MDCQLGSRDGLSRPLLLGPACLELRKLLVDCFRDWLPSVPSLVVPFRRRASCCSLAYRPGSLQRAYLAGFRTA